MKYNSINKKATSQYASRTEISADEFEEKSLIHNDKGFDVLIPNWEDYIKEIESVMSDPRRSK